MELGNGQDPEPPPGLRLPARPRAVCLGQRLDGHEEGILRRRLQTSGGLPQREVRRVLGSSFVVGNEEVGMCRLSLLVS